MAKVAAMNILIIIFVVNIFLLIIGVAISWIDIYMFGSGLYLALVSIVTLVIVLAFCLVGPDEHHEPVAKQMWSKSRQTIRRYTIRGPRLMTAPIKPPSPRPPPDSDTPIDTNQDLESSGPIKVRVYSPESTTKSESDPDRPTENHSLIDNTSMNGVDPPNGHASTNHSPTSACRLQTVHFADSDETAVYLV